jgi:hypothetical protein
MLRWLRGRRSTSTLTRLRSHATNASIVLTTVTANFPPAAGDWDGDGADTIGLYYQPEARFFLKDANVSGNTGFRTVDFGSTAADLPVVK